VIAHLTAGRKRPKSLPQAVLSGSVAGVSRWPMQAKCGRAR